MASPISLQKRPRDASVSEPKTSAKRSKPDNSNIIDLTSSPPGPGDRRSNPKTTLPEPYTVSQDFAVRNSVASPIRGPPLSAAGSSVNQAIAIDDENPSSITDPTTAGSQAPGHSGMEPTLCGEQRSLVDLILSGRNVFYTGSAGCGKSTVLRAFVKELKARGKKVKIIAPTGRAAVDIGGQTIFAYAGLTPDSLKLKLEELKKKAWGKAVLKRLKYETDVLVLDEVSMVENHLLERLSEMMKSARGNRQSFGGAQVVFLGDFYQLPPVKPFGHCYTCGRPNRNTQNVYECPRGCGIWRDEEKWAFCSKAWKEANFICINLTSIHRQKDQRFIAILEKCRTSQPLSAEDKNLLLNHKCNVANAVRLYPTRAEVKQINDAEFAKLKTPQKRYNCLDHMHVQPQHAEQLKWKMGREPDDSLSMLKDHRFERQLDLKEGMLVILLVNLDIDCGLINGSQGVIVGWEDDGAALHPVAFDNRKVREKEPDRPIIGGDYQATKIDAIKRFAAAMPDKKWPIVKFSNGITRTIIAECQLGELGDESPYSYQYRVQIPLLPAWAITVHKSQGMTLSKVIVNLAKNFEDGQTYVALSRAKSLDGLLVFALGRQSSGPNEEVKAFLEEQFGKPKITVG